MKCSSTYGLSTHTDTVSERRIAKRRVNKRRIFKRRITERRKLPNVEYYKT